MFRRPAGSKSETEITTPAVPPNQVNPARDFDTNPYHELESRVAEYLVEITGIGGGDDPIGFLIASHRAIPKPRPIPFVGGKWTFRQAIPAPKFPIGTEVLDWRSPVHSAVRKVTKHEFREGKWWYSRLENGACIFPEDDLRPARPSVIQSIEEAVNRVESRQEKQ